MHKNQHRKAGSHRQRKLHHRLDNGRKRPAGCRDRCEDAGKRRHGDESAGLHGRERVDESREDNSELYEYCRQDGLEKSVI